MKTNRNKYPLVTIKYREEFKDYLECGHILPTPQDIIGNRYPVKRRCHKCAKGKNKDY